MVRPGDTMLLKMELMAPIRRGICEMKGTVYVGNKVMAEGELVAQIVKREPWSSIDKAFKTVTDTINFTASFAIPFS